MKTQSNTLKVHAVDATTKIGITGFIDNPTEIYNIRKANNPINTAIKVLEKRYETKLYPVSGLAVEGLVA